VKTVPVGGLTYTFI